MTVWDRLATGTRPHMQCRQGSQWQHRSTHSTYSPQELPRVMEHGEESRLIVDCDSLQHEPLFRCRCFGGVWDNGLGYGFASLPHLAFLFTVRLYPTHPARQTGVRLRKSQETGIWDCPKTMSAKILPNMQ